jgi:hypothetical protein
VTTFDTAPDPAADVVRTTVSLADRQRRAREASRHVWRIAPGVAAMIFVVAALAHWRGWPAAIPVLGLSVSLVGLTLYIFVARRARPISDPIAAAIDAEAEMNGELRSASWFASRPERTAWADLHLQRAAARLDAIDWMRLYPTVRARRAQLATAVLTIAAVGLTITIPERVGLQPAAAAAADKNARPTTVAPGALEMLSPELQAQLEALLAAVEKGDLATAQSLASNANLRDLLKKLGDLNDPATLEALARAMSAAAEQKPTAAEEMKALADRARQAAESAALSKDMQEALEKLADQLEIAKPQPGEAREASGASAGAPKPGNEAQGAAAEGVQDASIQFSKQADAGAPAGMMMMSSPDAEAAAGPPGAGVGGSGSPEAGASAMAALEAALKQETIEASQDDSGDNVETEIRRKTEQGDASVAFTRGASGTFDRSRAAAPPPVPEARRSGVQTYFIRKQ